MWLVRLRLGILEMGRQEVALLDRDMDLAMVMMGEAVEQDPSGAYRPIVRDRLAYGTPCRSTNDTYAVRL